MMVLHDGQRLMDLNPRFYWPAHYLMGLILAVLLLCDGI